MWYRSLLAVGLIFGVSAAQAATLTSFVVTCVDRQEVSADDIFLAASRDGQPVPWGDAHQEGTSVGNSINMTDGGVFTLDAKSLAELNFTDTLQIVINEKDVTANEVIGTVNITPGDGTKSLVFKNDDFEYRVEYTVE